MGTQFNTAGARNRAASQSAQKIGMATVDSMRQFNYFGNNPAMPNNMDEDVELLEREIESVMMRKGSTAVGSKRDRLDHNIVNMTTSGFNDGPRTQTAGMD